MSNYSHSRISTYETCPLQFKFQYVDKTEVEIENTVEAFLGSLVHDVLEKLYKDLTFQKMNTLQDLLDHFNKLWDEQWTDNILIVRKEYTIENWKKMGEKYITDYYEHYKPFDQHKTIKLETEEFVDLDEFKFHVRIDRLVDAGNGVYEIHDYKTARDLPSQEKLDQDRQLALYSLWVFQKYKDAKKVILIWHYLAFDKEVSSQRSSEQLEQLKKETLETIREIEKATDFPAKQSALCSWCVFKQLCPKFKHLFKTQELEENEYLNDPGVKLVDKYIKAMDKKKEINDKIDIILDKIKEAMFRLGKKEGVSVLYGTDQRATLWSKKVSKFPQKNTLEYIKLVKKLKELKKFDEVAQLDSFALSKIVQDKRWTADILKELEPFETKEQLERIYAGKKK